MHIGYLSMRFMQVYESRCQAFWNEFTLCAIHRDALRGTLYSIFLFAGHKLASHFYPSFSFPFLAFHLTLFTCLFDSLALHHRFQVTIYSFSFQDLK